MTTASDFPKNQAEVWSTLCEFNFDLRGLTDAYSYAGGVAFTHSPLPVNSALKNLVLRARSEKIGYAEVSVSRLFRL